MGLLDDLSKRESKPESKPEPPMVGHYGVRLDLQEEKVSLTAGQAKEFTMVVMNTGTEDDTIRLKIDLVYNSELPDPPEWTVKLFGVEDKVWDVTFTKVTEKEFMLAAVTVTVPLPVRLVSTVSLAVTVRLPAVLRVTALVKVYTPASPDTNMWSEGRTAWVSLLVRWTVPV